MSSGRDNQAVRVLIVGDHPWAGHTGVLIGEGIEFKHWKSEPMYKVWLDAGADLPSGHECFAQKKHLRRIEPGREAWTYLAANFSRSSPSERSTVMEPQNPSLQREIDMGAALPLYTIYRHPRDYPGKYVVRRFVIRDQPIPDAEPLGVTESLDQARRLLPRGLVQIKRHATDDPVIVETWV